MLFSLGLTADAAAAHCNGLSGSVRPTSKGNLPSAAAPPSVIISKIAALEEPPPAPPARADQGHARSGSDGSARSMMTIDARDDGGDSVDSEPEPTPPPRGTPDAAGSRTPGTPSRMTRPKTSFHLAHPPPSFINRQRLRIRPRLLLQLQRVSATARPSPALDVLPSTILPPGLARRFPRFFRGKDRLGPDDLVIMTSETYDSTGPEGRAQQDELDARHVVATVSQRRKDHDWRQGKAEVCLSDGPLWEATPLSTGAYEFVAVDEHGLRTTARWVPRRSTTTAAGAGTKRKTNSPEKDEKRFSFSLINPSYRRHPIIASMTPSTIDVLDAYPTSAPPATPRSPSSDTPERSSFFDGAMEPTLTQTDEALRTLILVTGVWVAFREGWSQSFSYDDPMSPAVNLPSTGGARPPISNRSVSNPVRKSTEARSFGPAGSPDPQGSQGQMSRTMSRFMHRSHGPADPPLPSANGSSPTRQRAKSTGASLLHTPDGPSHSKAQRSASGFSLASSRHDDAHAGPDVPQAHPQQADEMAWQETAGREPLQLEDETQGSLPPNSNPATSSNRDKRNGQIQQPPSPAKKRWAKLKGLFFLTKRRSRRR